MHQTGMATVDGARLYYEVAGDGPAVVLIHAGIADCRMWDSQLEQFSQRYRTIRYDIRGFGRSSVVEERFSPRQDLRGLLDALDIHHAAVVGLSLGGGLARDFALEFGERVSALVSVAAGLPRLAQPPADLLARWNSVERAVAEDNLDYAVREALALWLDGPQRPEGYVGGPVRDRMAEMLRTALTRVFTTNRYEAPLDPPAADRLAEIRAPTLVIWGDQDISSVQVGSQAVASRIPGAQQAIFPDTAHMVNLERPSEFNALVHSFLQRVL